MQANVWEKHFAKTAELVRVLTARNLYARYRGSFLGIVWSALNPLAMTAVYYAIFGLQFSRYFHDSPIAYATSVYVGLVAITFFVGATSNALTSIVSNGILLTKVRVEPDVFPDASVMAYAFQLFVGSGPIFVVILLISNHDPLRLALLPIALAALVCMAVGVGEVVAALYVYFRDIPHPYDLLMFLLWVTTPVFYPIGIVSANVRRILMWNPLYPLIASLRSIVLGSGPLDWVLLGIALGAGILTLVVGRFLFRSMQAGFADRL